MHIVVEGQKPIPTATITNVKEKQKDLIQLHLHGHFHAWISNCRREASTACETILGRLGAGEAARLAPAKQASCLAVLEAIVSHGVVALGATRADAEIRLDARSELVVVDAAQAKSLLAASILLLADVLGISECRLVISTTGTSDLQAVLARCSNCRGEASAAFETILGRLSAGEAARLAPAKQACGLAVLEAVVSHGVVALGATRADAEIGLDARRELVVVDAAQAKSLL